MDAEGVALRGDEVLVSFEQDHRVEVYPDPGFENSPIGRFDPAPRPDKIVATRPWLRNHRRGAAREPAEGWRSSSSRKRAGISDGNRLWRDPRRPAEGALFGERARTTSIRPMAPSCRTAICCCWSGVSTLPTASACASGASGAPRSSRAPWSTAKSCSTADFGYQIDNMEGLDTFQAPDGTTHVIVVSDDNHSILRAEPDAGIPSHRIGRACVESGRS